ncbi:MAG: nicotinate (nicotinamide) nucleotide adenylyltransferase [Ruminococcus sp.]|nr:nicotinate (nicotinamide) nucleotide adenylyltransferase [Ruminococcus sp.]
MRTAIFGGTFDPVHLGHRYCLESVMKNVGLDRVFIIPDRIPPHKQRQDIASGSDRLEMLRRTFADTPGTEISDWELRREGKSYSVLTLRHFHSLYPDDRLYFIMGSDMLLCFDKWYCWEEILSLCGLICVSRRSTDKDRLEQKAKTLRAAGAEVIIVPVEPFEASSSEIRQMIRNGEDCSGFMDKNTLDYIKNKDLYAKRDFDD